MKRSVIRIYATTVCFAAVVSGTIAGGFTLYSIERLILPMITADLDRASLGRTSVETRPIAPSATTHSQLREEARAYGIEQERQSGLRGVFLWGSVLLVSALLWLVHWRLLNSRRIRSV